MRRCLFLVAVLLSSVLSSCSYEQEETSKVTLAERARAIRNQGRLTVAEYEIKTIFKTDPTESIFGFDLKPGNRVLIYRGTAKVRVSVDLSSFGTDCIENIDSTRIQVRVPRPQVQSIDLREEDIEDPISIITYSHVRSDFSVKERENAKQKALKALEYRVKTLNLAQSSENTVSNLIEAWLLDLGYEEVKVLFY